MTSSGFCESLKPIVVAKPSLRTSSGLFCLQFWLGACLDLSIWFVVILRFTIAIQPQNRCKSLDTISLCTKKWNKNILWSLLRISWGIKIQNIKITAPKCRRTLSTHRKDMKGHGWTKLERIEMDCIWVKRRSTFFQIYVMSVYTCIKMSFTQLENHSQFFFEHDFANERPLVCQFDV